MVFHPLSSPLFSLITANKHQRIIPSQPQTTNQTHTTTRPPSLRRRPNKQKNPTLPCLCCCCCSLPSPCSPSPIAAVPTPALPTSTETINRDPCKPLTQSATNRNLQTSQSIPQKPQVRNPLVETHGNPKLCINRSPQNLPKPPPPSLQPT